MGFLRRLENTLAERERLKQQEGLEKSAYTIVKFGFQLNTERDAKVNGLMVNRMTTVGLWCCDMPDLLAYGPFDFQDSDLLMEVLFVYLVRGERPKDGDQLLIRDKRITLRLMTKEDSVSDEMWLSFKVINRNPLLTMLCTLPEGFQLVGEHEPPKICYSGPPAQTRTVACEEEFSVERCVSLARDRRVRSHGLGVNHPSVAH